MAPWKVLLSIIVFLLPGGSLVLAAWAALKAWGIGRARLRQRQPAFVEAAVVAAAEGAKG